MDGKDEALLKRLLPMFRAEAEDHLKAIAAGLIEMESAEPGNLARIVETVFRESHSLKGAARSVNMTDVVALCQSMENVFSALKRKVIPPSAEILDLLHRAVDSASKLAAGEALSPSERSSVGRLIHQLEEAAQRDKEGTSAGEERAKPVKTEEEGGKRAGSEAEPTPIESVSKETAVERRIPAAPESTATPGPAPVQPGTVRVATTKLDALLLQAEEMLALKLAAAQHASELSELQREFARWKKAASRSSFRVPGGAEDRDAKAPQGDAASLLAAFETRLNDLVKSAEHDRRSFGARIDDLLYDMKKALMQPFSSLLELFPKLVRDLAREAGKEARFSAEGGDIEVDRRVLEELKDPLIHLVRNGIDHGIEKPDARRRKGKPPGGRIGIAVSSRDGKIEVVVSDDGAGIEESQVRAAAEASRSISGEEAQSLDAKDALLLIFRSGVTTSPIVTDISGRGLGLAIVRESVEKLGGTVAVETRPDVGTTFRMAVPLTLATFRGILVRVGEQLFILPSANVESVVRFRKEAIVTVENRETLSVGGRVLSLARLEDVLELRASGASAEAAFLQVVVLGSAEKRMAFLVDEVLGEQEVLAKSLGRQLSRVRNVAGATILGNGKVVPILNVSDLMVSAVKLAPAPSRTPAARAAKRASVLVVEDSITARALLKTILESAGYEVTAAVDGIEGLTALKSREFDLVVSDVDMPRMNGFELTAKIRADKKLSALPVVLVTALDSREDRERGIEVGANAYIVKSSFEQSNLLEVVRRFI